ncbi:TonB-dependent receptor [Pontixanthobacter aestiaquae]|uniref:TonB-dependent receptor n=1 Tax=Pontixanthobacter aestiaquae TaxID=1509367 RepID=A0A844Z7Z0_9SPHN|nr:TonB-dependent receptor [Pontixanthobacter aestiaquae]MDN3645072.1 TonB-dependent receptor [Pontixanthobacter aestiaquae]MXO83928.1 TonB-dependent receptor [Pontixanthobacter aestiaquae]
MRKYLLLLSCSAIWAAPSAAQDSGTEVDQLEPAFAPANRIADEQITVTATGSRSEVEDTGQAVTIIGRDEIENVQGADLARVLERAPGIAISRNGGIGAVTSVRVRGADAEQLLVIVDGVRAADPASPSGGFDFGNLQTGNVDKIDLLRGSNSTIWGSDAIGGVLVATTRDETGFQASAEYGARDTIFGAATGGVQTDAFYVGLSGSYLTTDGFSSAASGTEADGFEQWDIAGRSSLYVSDQITLFARGRFAEGDLDIDGFPAPAFALADTDEFQKTQQYSAAAGASYDNGPLYLTASYSFADTERQNFNPAFGNAPGFTSDGHSDRIELRGEWRPIGPLIVNFGGENEWTSLETNFTARQETRIAGAYAQLGIEFGGLSAHIGARHDDHRDFGGATSFGADISYEVAEDIRLRASVGEGFKAPSLFQLFSDFGNDLLEPEQSTSFDLGIAWHNRNDPFYAGVTAFQRDSENQIEFVSCFGVVGGICTNRPFGTYDNVGKVRAQGFEVELGANPSNTFGVAAVYAYVDTQNRTAGAANEGNILARRPKHALTFTADWETPLAGLTVGGDIRMVGDSFDDAGNFTRLDGYHVVTLRASVPFGETVELFGRVENIFDEEYQTAAGFGTPGRGAFVGARATF